MSDVGISGVKSRAERPGFNACLNMLDSLRELEFNCSLIIISLDRLYRDLGEIAILRKYLKNKKIGMYVLQNNADMTSDDKELEFNILSSIAQNERSMISRRVKANLFYRKSIGPVKYRPRFGWKSPGKGMDQVPDEKEMEVVDRIREMRIKDEKCSISEIKSELNDSYPAADFGYSEWHHTVLERIIYYHDIPGNNKNYGTKPVKVNIPVCEKNIL
jgi:DNA invertase Pin-like site-specific DNA recombinase